MDYTPRELMVVCAARQIHDGEHVFVGMRLPLLAFALAKLTHAPECVGLFEAGLLRDTPSAELLYTMGDPANIAGALWATSTLNVMALMAITSQRLLISNSENINDPPRSPLCSTRPYGLGTNPVT